MYSLLTVIRNKDNWKKIFIEESGSIDHKQKGNYTEVETAILK